MFMGWWVTIGAMLIAVVLAVVLADRASKGKARSFMQHSWLGLANGGVALVFWAWFILYVS